MTNLFFKNAILLWILLMGLSASFGQQTYRSKVGVGLEGIGGRGMEFVDAAKTLRPWEALNGGSVQTDAAGWPLEDARTVFFDLRPTYAWAPPADDPDDFQINVSGKYHLSFEGQAVIQSPLGPDAFYLANQIYDSSADRTHAEIHLPAGKGLLIVGFVQTNGGIRDVRLSRPGYPPDSGQTFTEEFLEALQPFTVLRFMDWLHTNNNNPPYPLRTEWQNRKLKTDATQSSFGAKKDGVAWEYVIELANQTGKEIWINIPVAASDQYVRSLAQLFRETLRLRIPIYLEYSNEVWNPGFTQAAWNGQAARDEAIGNPNSPLRYDSTLDQTKWERRNVAKRLVEISAIFAEFYGEEAINDTIRPVLAGWSGRTSEFQDQLLFIQSVYGPPGDHIYAIAEGPYFNNLSAPSNSSVQQLLDTLQASSDAQVSKRVALQNLANQYNIQHFAYEGGPDSGGSNLQVPESNVVNRILAQRHPRMKDLILRDMRENWFELGGDLFMYFTLSSAYSRWGMWGLTEDITRLEGPKLEAIYELTGIVPGVEPGGVIFPQYATGQQNKTRVILRNNSPQDDTGQIRFRNSSGQVVDTIDYDLGPWFSLDYETPGTGGLASGVVEVVSELGAASRVEGTEVFQILGGFVSLDQSPVRRYHQLYVSRNAAENTGLAMFNPNEEIVLITAVLLDGDGQQVGEALLDVSPKQQLVGFVDQSIFFESFFQSHTGDFHGTLNLYCHSDSGVAVAGLLQRRDTGALIAVSSSPNAYVPQ